MKKTIRLTEQDLMRIVKRIIKEDDTNKISPLNKFVRLGIHSAIIATIILNVDVIHVTDKYGNDVDVNVGDTFVCEVVSIVEKRGGLYYIVNAEDKEGNTFEFNYSNPNFSEGDKIKVKVGRAMANYYMKGASEVDRYKPKNKF